MPQRVAAPASIDHPGDEALTAEHLVCTEEERVRLPPSPCPPPMPALPASARDSTIDTFSPHESPSRKAKRCDGVRRVAAPTTHASVVSRAARTLRTVAAQVRLLPEALFTNARSSEDEHRRAKAVDAGSTPAGRIYADVVSTAERRVASPEVPVRFGPSASLFSQACGVTESIASSNLVGPGSSPGGPAFLHARSSRAEAARLSRGRRPPGPAVRIRSRTHPTTATKHRFCCGPKQVRLSTPHRQVAGSNPARSFSLLR